MPQEQAEPELIRPDVLILNDGQRIMLRKDHHGAPVTGTETWQMIRKAAKAPAALMGGLAVGSYLYFSSSSELHPMAETVLGTLWSVGPTMNWFGRRLLKEFETVEQ